MNPQQMVARMINLQTLLEIGRKQIVIPLMRSMLHNFLALLDNPSYGLALMLVPSRAALQKTITCSFGCTQPSTLMLRSLSG